MRYETIYFWNAGQCSVYSGIPVVDYDVTKDMRTKKAFTMEAAVCAITRICDGIHENKTKYVKLSSKKATTPSIDLTADGTVTNISELPRLTGFVLNAFTGEDKIYQSPEDVANVANWGFTSVRVMINYHMLFNDSADRVDLYQLEKLDELVATAEHYKIHLNILMYQLPGRESWSDENYDSGGDFDLFINKKKQKKVCNIWKMLAARYKDVPGDHLSFTPFWEAMNKNLSTGAEYTDYTDEDVANTLDKIIAAMRTVDKDCFILYELTANNGYDDIVSECQSGYRKISKKYKNTMISYNYCEMPFVYHNMNATQGENVDNNNHSMFLPDYPTLIYSAKNHFSEDSTMIMDGFLPEGTTITLTLKKDVESISFACPDGWIAWSGMDVTLPKKYAKKKWYSISSYDQYLSGVTSNQQFEKRSTSNIMICPNDNENGTHLTINKDLTYTSESLYGYASAEYADAWGKSVSSLSKNCIVRFETSTFSNGATRSATNSYYESLLSMYDTYGFNWYSNDYEQFLGCSRFFSPLAQITPRGYNEGN